MIRLMPGIWLAGALLLCGVVEGQTLSGTVRDALSSDPLPGAHVACTCGGQTVHTATDFEGSFALELPGALPCTLNASFIGWEDQTVRVTGLKPLDLALASRVEAIGPVVVSAGRFEQAAERVTVSLDVLPPRVVESRGTTSLETALEQSPGVSFVDGEPQIRSGSGFSYGAGSRVMVLVDDLPILSGDAGRPTWGFLPLENLEQIEIIKGASSVLYGSAALSGVINVRTRYPDARPLTRVSLQHGGFSRPQTDLARTWDGIPQQTNLRLLHSRQLGNWDVVIGANVIGDQGALAPIDSTSAAGYQPWSADRFASEARARMNVNLRKRTTAIPGLQYGLRTNWQRSNALATLIWAHAPDSLYHADGGSATRTLQTAGTVDPFVSYLAPSGVRHDVRARWQHLVNDNDNNQSNASDVLYAEYQIHLLGDRWQLPGLNLTAGAVNQQTWSTSELYSGGNSNGENQALNASAYVQADLAAGERWNLSTGVRYEHFNVNGMASGKPVFRAGANYQAGQATFFRASFGQGFRFPTIAELYIRTGLGTLQVYPNEALRPETSWSAEWGVKQGVQWGGLKGFFDVALFEQRYEDFIEFTFGQWGLPTDPLVGLGFTSKNTGSSKVNGAEASFTGRVEWGKTTLDFIGGYTFTRPMSLNPDYDYGERSTYLNTSYDTIPYTNLRGDTVGMQLKYRSPHLVRLDVQASRGNWSLGASGRYQTALRNFDNAFVQFEQYNFVDWGLQEWLDNNPELPWIWDVRVGYTAAERHLFSLVVSNVTNREYAVRPLAIEPPRLVSLLYTFTLD